jgi:hypothetical protein
MTLEQEQSPPLHAARTRQRWLCALLVAACAVVVFGRLCSYEFTNWDDNATVWENKSHLPPTASSLWHVYTHEAATAHIFVPVTWTVWWLLATVAVQPTDHGRFALDPRVYHTANVALHVLTSVLVFVLLRRLLARGDRDTRSDRGIGESFDWPACFGALLFALHPVQVETVAWVSGTKDLLAGLFMVIAILQYLRYATAAAPESRLLHYVLLLFAGVLAMLSKPSAVALPLVIACIDALLLRRRLVDILRGVLPLFMVIAPVLIWSRLSQTPQGLPTLVSPPLRPLVALDALAFYLGKIAWPAHLTVDYGRYPKLVVESGRVWFTWITPVTVGVITWFLRRRVPVLATGAAMFVAALLPVLGLVPFDFQQYSTVADHYLYVPMIGIGLAAAGVLARVPRGRSLATVATGCAAGIIVLTSGARSVDQTKRWRDSFSLFEHAVAVNGRSWLGYNNLAEAWAARGRRDLAERYARRSIEINPESFPARMNLGVALLERNDIPRATHEFAAAARLQPLNVEARINLAMAYARADRMDEAIAQYRFVLNLDKGNGIAKEMLKLALKYQNDLRRRTTTRPATTVTTRTTTTAPAMR